MSSNTGLPAEKGPACARQPHQTPCTKIPWLLRGAWPPTEDGLLPQGLVTRRCATQELAGRAVNAVLHASG